MQLNHPFLSIAATLLTTGCGGDTATELVNGACVPEGERFVDRHSCEDVPGPTGDPERDSVAAVPPNADRNADPDLAWTVRQAQACSCICCHGPGGQGRWIWDHSFEPAWTDSASDRIVRELGYGKPGLEIDFIPADDNFGFSRFEVGGGLPTTDRDRLQRFVDRELDRRMAASE